MEISKQERRTFLIRQILKGLFFLAVLIIGFLVFEKAFPANEREVWFGSIYDNISLVLSIFITSEVLFGIIPPEVFMLWALRTGHLGQYFIAIGILSLISYLAGAFNFNLGRWIRNTRFFVRIRRTWLQNSLLQLQRYGGYLIVVAALTPLPFSAIALLSGAGNVDSRTYYINSLWRIVRYFVYALILYETSL
ncbi:VTT domain-containing protein [Lunatimonas salinarum]|uniref:VTT domain-containing protein n=1 Tax=Lunatimonas salinarum TaxID=1774590 RepID=UPI001FD75184|nr:VTT domain-containing protein [Lunatimonas salinarum]